MLHVIWICFRPWSRTFAVFSFFPIFNFFRFSIFYFSCGDQYHSLEFESCWWSVGSSWTLVIDWIELLVFCSINPDETSSVLLCREPTKKSLKIAVLASFSLLGQEHTPSISDLERQGARGGIILLATIHEERKAPDDRSHKGKSRGIQCCQSLPSSRHFICSSLFVQAPM